MQLPPSVFPEIGLCNLWWPIKNALLYAFGVRDQKVSLATITQRKPI